MSHTISDLLRDLEALYEASIAASSFPTALKVKELILRLSQHKEMAVPDLSVMTDTELESFVMHIKEQSAQRSLEKRKTRVRRTAKQPAEEKAPTRLQRKKRGHC
ncbi:MAG: hypothetical protein LBF76_01085 [Holosporales bacterium]|jgi:replicative DNA helicase|nr:hypothetical protein [Holosporales bacterium]